MKKGKRFCVLGTFPRTFLRVFSWILRRLLAVESDEGQLLE